jgi:hypothetical protein
LSSKSELTVSADGDHFWRIEAGDGHVAVPAVGVNAKATGKEVVNSDRFSADLGLERTVFVGTGANTQVATSRENIIAATAGRQDRQNHAGNKDTRQGSFHDSPPLHLDGGKVLQLYHLRVAQ